MMVVVPLLYYQSFMHKSPELRISISSQVRKNSKLGEHRQILKAFSSDSENQASHLDYLGGGGAVVDVEARQDIVALYLTFSAQQQP